ncbi:hypothetical protein BDP27DRAFT_1418386 [Rhodocollybia butyracea]|uniref:Uncharacterized protein n=1 Tax=Rhodocollybia butyracea TaxID=206335 RepID=A0A9P5PTF7_9AGAR|nr:hypothetical protein BDP27DRAFT_1418386 [Rhodocollybia butyracea]
MSDYEDEPGAGEFDDEPKCIFNEGLGICYSPSIKPTHPPLRPGAKPCRANAKKPAAVLCEAFYCHKDTYIADLLDTALSHVQEKRNGPNELDFKIVTNTVQRNFDIIWNAGRGEKGMLNTAEGYKDMLRQCTGNIDLCIEEYDTTPELSEEQIQENDFITKLTTDYRCQDQKCSSPQCFVDTAGTHVNLTLLHLCICAAAMAANAPNVDMEHPPLDKAPFKASDGNEVDIALLASRRLGQEQQRNAPNVYVNLSGFGDLIHQAHAPLQPLPNATLNNASSQPSSQPSLCPKLSLTDFREKYGLSYTILCKLEAADITSPHGLRFLSPTELREEVHLTLGEQCDVLDALERWTKGMD